MAVFYHVGIYVSNDGLTVASESCQLEAMVQRFVPPILRFFAGFSSELAAEAALRIFTTPRRIPRPDWEERLIVAARGQRRTLGAKMAAISFGPPSAPAVLLIHGWEGRGTQLGVLIEPLVAQGLRVVALDIIAHGESAGRRVNIGELVGELLQVIEELREESGRVAGVVAHSFGAGAAILALGKGAAVGRMIIVAAPSSLARVAEAFAKSVLLSAKVSAAFYRRLGAWTGIPLEQTDLAVLAEEIRVPGLIVHDPQDKWVSFHHAERFLAHWPNAKLISLRNVGHHKILKSPLFVAAVSEFLANEATGGA